MATPILFRSLKRLYFLLELYLILFSLASLQSKFSIHGFSLCYIGNKLFSPYSIIFNFLCRFQFIVSLFNKVVWSERDSLPGFCGDFFLVLKRMTNEKTLRGVRNLLAMEMKGRLFENAMMTLGQIPAKFQGDTCREMRLVNCLPWSLKWLRENACP